MLRSWVVRCGVQEEHRGTREKKKSGTMVLHRSQDQNEAGEFWGVECTLAVIGTGGLPIKSGKVSSEVCPSIISIISSLISSSGTFTPSASTAPANSSYDTVPLPSLSHLSNTCGPDRQTDRQTSSDTQWRAAPEGGWVRLARQPILRDFI
eukprot:1195870-Prorocentrum_minimum.AAC.5